MDWTRTGRWAAASSQCALAASNAGRSIVVNNISDVQQLNDSFYVVYAAQQSDNRIWCQA
jgi:hypothetical protein